MRHRVLKALLSIVKMCNRLRMLLALPAGGYARPGDNGGLMHLHAGTSGFSYKEWLGSFYPEKLAQKKMLSYFASQLGTVEINNTFYRMPTAELLLGWAEQVPAHFMFALKTPQRITHIKKLADCADDMGVFVERAVGLGKRLGPILVQLPPYLRRDDQRLGTFLEALPKQHDRYTLEFRHASWFCEEVYSVLRSYNVALCAVDGEDESGKDKGAPLVGTTTGPKSWGYARLRRPNYDDAALKTHLESFRALGWSDAFVYFKHEDAGAGPRFAKMLLALDAG